MSKDYESTYSQSIETPMEFWEKAAEDVHWYKKWDKVLDYSKPHCPQWFNGGLVNSCYNALDLHVAKGRGKQLALIYDSPVTNIIKKYTYSELLNQVACFAGILMKLGAEKGDRVTLYMPMIPETIIAMLACARIGVIHSMVYGGLTAQDLATRINDTQPKLVISASCGFDGGHIVPYKSSLDQAIEIATAKPEKNIIFQRPQLEAPLVKDRDLSWSVLMNNAKPVDCVPVEASDPLYILHTSGTTGNPKGVVRDNGGHLVALKWTMKHIYGVNQEDVFWAASEIGRVAGHSYLIYAPLFQGCTTILYEGKPIGIPNPDDFWRVIFEHQVNTLFTAPSALRRIMREDPYNKYLRQHDITSLRAIFLAGERCNADTHIWAEKSIGVPVIDHWWQTETGWPVGANCIGLGMFQIKPGSCTKPVPGYEVCVLNNSGKELDANELGNIVIKLPLPPGCILTLWKNYYGFQKAYLDKFPGCFYTGDVGYIDNDGYLWVMGRSEDIINVAGYQVSTGSIEEILAGHPDVVECAVFGVSDPVHGEIPFGTIVVKMGIERDPKSIINEVIKLVLEKMGSEITFKTVTTVKRLPKTRSDKIMRGVLKKIAEGKDYQIPSTINDPSILNEIEETFANLGYPFKGG